MKRNLLILLCACSLLISCQQQEQFATIDFGTAEFEEPFRGLLASQPSWLVATLDWPILRILKSDTVVLSKTIEIGFNEDAVRSNSSARIFFVDENGNTSKKYQISCNNTPMGKDGYDLKATSEPQQLELVVKVDPSIGDTTVRGYISIMGNEIDEVNSIPLTEEGAQNVAQWSFTHEIGWPLMIWKIWMFLLILLIILIVYLLKFLVIGIASLGNSSAIAGAATSVSSKSSITKPIQNYTNNPNNKKNNKKDNLSWQEKVHLQTGWSLDLINQMNSEEEARIYMRAGLQERIIGGRKALVRWNIDWAAFNCQQEWLKSKLTDYDHWKNYNNADLIGEGYPPRDSNGDPYELHHIGQHQDSPFAELTWSEHMGDGNNSILHPRRESEIDRNQFDKEKSAYWQARFAALSEAEKRHIYGK